MYVFDISNNFKEVKENLKIEKSRYWILLKADEIYKIKNMFILDEEALNECINLDQFPKLNFFWIYIYSI